MIDLTPLEVRQKKDDFRRAFRGYDAELVNDFLDLVADRMEELVKANMALSDAVHALESEVGAYREKERALSDALMTAQKLREDARAHAEKEGELLLREARLAADEAREEAARGLIREEEALRQIRARRAQLVQSFRRLLERELSELEVIEETLELAGPETGRREAPAGEAGARAAGGARKPAGRAGAEAAGGAAAGAEGAARASGAAEPRGGEAGGGEAQARAEGPKPGSKPAAKPAAKPEPEAGGEKDEDGAQRDWLSSLVEE